MAEILNLNRFRKARAKVKGGKQAAENRVKSGRAKAEKQLAKSQAEQSARRLDGLKRDPPEPGNAS